MSKNLVIVESPAKCKKIQGFLGPNYIVKASFGHIRNLDKKKGINAVDISNNFKPHFAIINEKRKYINELKKIVKNCKEVIIASDLDREGEAIGFHLVKVLNLNLETTKRIVFNEITKSAIQNAVKNFRTLDKNLIYAQQARQILDFVIGFEISPVLWKHVKNNLSAGRCQSPALRLVYDKKLEIEKFNAKTYFDFKGKFKNIHDVNFDCKSKCKVAGESDVLKLFEQFKNAKFTIETIEKTTSKSKPSAPYITSTIQQDASSKLGLSPKRTMGILQKLYEAGKITYMRTDSKVLSQECANKIENLVKTKYGDSYHNARKFKNKTKNAQEAHECLRPVDVNLESLGEQFEGIDKRLYNLIWKRAVCSQMAEMQTTVMKITIKNDQNNVKFLATFEKIVFLGYNIVNKIPKTDEISTIEGKIEEGESVDIIEILSDERLTKAPGRFTEASLIKELEKKGIGRPSTFSNIIETLFKRAYIVKETRKGKDKKAWIYTLSSNLEMSKKEKLIKTDNETKKIFITELGELVIKFLIENFEALMDFKFTSEMENNLDEIAKGNENWKNIIKNVYDSFHPKVIELGTQTKKIQWKKADAIGINPSNNKNVYCYKGKYGPVIQEGDGEHMRYVGLPKDYDVNNPILKDLLDFLEYPKEIYKLKDKPITMHYGQNGFYIKYDNKSYSVKSSDIKLDEIKELIANKTKNIVKQFSGGISIRNGNYGPYILKAGTKGKIVSIPSSMHDNLDKITLKECKSLLKAKTKYKRKK